MKDDKKLAATYRDPVKTFEGHQDNIIMATFPDGKRVATGSEDKTIRIWKLEDGKEMKKWSVKKIVGALVISRDGKQVISAEGDNPDEDYDRTEYDWQLWVRDAESGRVIAGPLDGHTNAVLSLDISPDNSVLASGSVDHTVTLWDMTTWQRKCDPLSCGAYILCIRFSPIGQLGIATSKDIQIWDMDRMILLTRFQGHANSNNSWNFSLAWSHDSTHLLSAGSRHDPVIRSWDTCTWKQDGDPWIGHDEDKQINHITLNPTGTLLASASDDHTVRLWQLSTGTEVARYEHSDNVLRVAFSVDGQCIFSGGQDRKISQWAIPEDVLTAALRDPLAGELQMQSGSWDGKRNSKGPLDTESSGQRRNQENRRLDRSPHGAAYSRFLFSARLHGVKHFFNRMWPSSDEKELGPKETPKVVHVPLAPPTYGDYVACEEDGVRPYSLFFCLSWFQKKEKKTEPTPQVYDIDLMKAEQKEDHLDVPIPNSRDRFAQQEDIELTSMASQS